MNPQEIVSDNLMTVPQLTELKVVGELADGRSYIWHETEMVVYIKTCMLTGKMGCDCSLVKCYYCNKLKPICRTWTKLEPKLKTLNSYAFICEDCQGFTMEECLEYWEGSQI